MSAPPPPPPTRTVKPASTPFSATTTDPPPRAWKARLKSLGAVGLEKGIKVSDWAGGHMNNLAEKVRILILRSVVHGTALVWKDSKACQRDLERLVRLQIASSRVR